MWKMDQKDEVILDLLKGNAKITYQEIGNRVGISRVAVKKRITRLEQEGIIRQYNTCIYRDDETTIIVDIVTKPEAFEDILRYIATRTAYIRQIYKTSKDFHIHFIATSTSQNDLIYLLRMIQKYGGNNIERLSSHVIEEIVKDVYGGVGYEQRYTISKNKEFLRSD